MKSWQNTSRLSDFITINEENRLRRKVEILEVKADKIAELQQTIDDVKSKLGLS
jgi:hypothetical protein